MSGCGSAINSLNDDEKLIFDNLTNNINKFFDPASVQIITCSDPFLNEETAFISTDFKYYFCPLVGHPGVDSWVENENYGKEKCVMIQITASDKNGGKSSVVYCLCLDGADKGDMYQHSEWINKLTIDSNSGDIASDKMAQAITGLFFSVLKSHAKSLLGCTLADADDDYPISQGSNVDTGKLNNALKEYFENKGWI